MVAATVVAANAYPATPVSAFQAAVARDGADDSKQGHAGVAPPINCEVSTDIDRTVVADNASLLAVANPAAGNEPIETPAVPSATYPSSTNVEVPTTNASELLAAPKLTIGNGSSSKIPTAATLSVIDLGNTGNM